MRVVKTILYLKGSERMPSVQKCNGFIHGAHAHGWRVQALTLSPSKSPNLERLLAFWKADGLVFDCGSFSLFPDLDDVESFPTVLLTSHSVAGFCSVGEDLRETAESAARELFQLGLHHFGFVHFPHLREWSTERARHFCAAVRLNGGTCATFQANDKLEMMTWTDHLRRWIRRLPKPCGIFAANDEVSNHIRGICATERISVPDEIAIVGVDNDESICANVHPNLSSVLADNEAIGFRAAHLMAEQFLHPRTHESKPRHLAVSPLMVVRRESTRRNIHADEQVLRAIEHIRENACASLRASDVLKLFNASRRTAEMHFREATGRSILDEIQRVRMERARELLCDGARPLKVIANLCGYTSESSFRKVYCAHFGSPPRKGLHSEGHFS